MITAKNSYVKLSNNVFYNAATTVKGLYGRDFIYTISMYTDIKKKNIRYLKLNYLDFSLANGSLWLKLSYLKD